MKRKLRYRKLPHTVFYEVLGTNTQRWAEAAIEFTGKPLEEDDLLGWFSAVIMMAYREGYDDATRGKRRRH